MTSFQYRNWFLLAQFLNLAKTNPTPHSACVIWIPSINKAWRVHLQGILQAYNAFSWTSIILKSRAERNYCLERKKTWITDCVITKTLLFLIVDGPTSPWQVLDIFLELNQWDIFYTKKHIQSYVFYKYIFN